MMWGPELMGEKLPGGRDSRSMKFRGWTGSPDPRALSLLRAGKARHSSSGEPAP